LEVWAKAKFLHVAPRKARLVAGAIKGKDIETALAVLAFLPNSSARMVAKVVKSAVANAENNYGLDPNKLVVTKVAVDGGPKLKRLRAKARGRPGYFVRRMSHVTVVVDDEGAA